MRPYIHGGRAELDRSLAGADGEPVATTVWIAQDNGELIVGTTAVAGKVK